TLATASFDGRVLLWNAATGALQGTLEHSDAVTSVAFSPRGDRILTASFDGTARLWTVAGELVRELRGHTGWVNAAAFLGSGDEAITGSFDGTVRRWELASGRCVRAVPGDGAAIYTVAVAGGVGLAGAADGTLRVLDLERGVVSR